MEMSHVEKVFVNNRLFDFWRVWTMQRVLRHVQPTRGPVLEIGCGKGTTTVEIARKLPGTKVIATDYDRGQVRLAKVRVSAHPVCSRQIKIERADATKLRFRKSTFSAAFAFLTLHHIENWRKALRELYRVLKTGAYLYIDDLACKPFPRLLHIGIAPPSMFTANEFVKELERVGFTVVLVRGWWKFVAIAKKR